jgi:hypothetical protein
MKRKITTFHSSILSKKIKKMIVSDALFDGRYLGKVIEIDSSTGSTETKDNIQKLLTIEKNTNPIEIVLHVYKLKRDAQLRCGTAASMAS